MSTSNTHRNRHLLRLADAVRRAVIEFEQAIGEKVQSIETCSDEGWTRGTAHEIEAPPGYDNITINVVD